MNMIMTKTRTLALAASMTGLTLGSIQSNRAAEDEVNYQPFTLGADVGTLGVGASASWRFVDHFGVRGGVSFFSQSDSQDIEGNTYDADLQLLTFPLGVDFFPSKRSSFRVTLGVMVNLNELEGSTPLGQPVILNGNQYNDASYALSMKAEQETISPYLAIGGNLFLDKAKHWSLGYELGVAYTGSPDVTLVGTGTFPGPQYPGDLEAERREIEDKAKDYKFHPIVKLSVNFSF